MKTEQEKQIRNHFLTLFIGECPHKWAENHTHCLLCHKTFDELSNLMQHLNPDFYTPNDRERLFKWMEENEPTLWEEYLKTWFNSAPHSITKDAPFTQTLNSVLNPSNLFEFLVEHREDWEIVNLGYDSCTTLPQREQHKAAKYLDSLEAT